MNRTELIKDVQERTERPRLAVDCVICEMMNAIRDAVYAGKEVRLIRFGTFSSKRRPARTGRNIKTGKKIAISAKTVPTFKASKDFLSKDRKPV